MASSKPPATYRRSQRERSETMQKRVLEATLYCIGQQGYQYTSLQDIAQAADVSRGAITHHFVNKLELCAAAIRYFVDWRQMVVTKAMETRRCESQADRLDALWETFLDVFPITLEILIALRADRELRQLVDRRGERNFEKIITGYGGLFTDASGLHLPRSVMSMITAFFRGLYIETLAAGPEEIAEIKAEFDIALLHVLQRHGLAESGLDAILNKRFVGQLTPAEAPLKMPDHLKSA